MRLGLSYGFVLDSLIFCILIACIILGEVDAELEVSILGPLTHLHVGPGVNGDFIEYPW
jgi:hypothetical protein